MPLLFTACVHWPAIATDCDSYGVTEDYAPMGNVVHVEPLHHAQLNSACAGVAAPNAAFGTELAGCAIARGNGMVDAYYSMGDQCAMNHELCHAKHGPGHTERYLQELKDGIPMPYCPRNQLSLKG